MVSSSFFWTLLVPLTFYKYSVSTALESIVNPSSSTVTCGTNDNCTVTCNGTNACNLKTFYFYNNIIHLMCSGETACAAVQIFTSNVQSFTASIAGPGSFLFSELYTSSTDIDIHVQCGPSSGNQECFGAFFYYLNQGQSTHICEGQVSCYRSTIHAISPVSLVCKGSSSCQIMSFILPSDEQLNQQSSLTVYSEYAPTTKTMKVYSLYPFTNVISADGVALDAIHFVYGMRFNQYCIVSDTSCMDAVATNIGNYDDLTIINTYPDGIPSQSLAYNGDLLIFATFEQTTFTPPSIPDTNTLSILCLDCPSVTFELGGVSNAVLSDASGDNLWYSTITGPTGTFELNIMHWSSDNKYYLQNTSTITARSFGQNAEVYLGKTLDVYVSCPLPSDNPLYWSCPNTNIWSTLQRHEIRLGTSTAGYWDLDTSYEFLIHFDFEEYPCTYLNYASNCSFMTFDPTNHPSYQPSQQTENPSSFPTDSPSNHPSYVPTQFLTNNPFQTPSHHPSQMPTSVHSHMPSSTLSMPPTQRSFASTINHIDYTPPPVLPISTEMIFIMVAVAILVTLGYVCIRHVIKRNRLFKRNSIQNNEEREEKIPRQELRVINAECEKRHVHNIIEVTSNTKTTTMGTADSLNIKPRSHYVKTTTTCATFERSSMHNNDQVEGVQRKQSGMEYTIEGPRCNDV